MMQASRGEVYDAPAVDWNNKTYTPVSNKLIMDLVDKKIAEAGLSIQGEEYKVARNMDGHIRGVIGSYNITTPDQEFGQRIMFRNSYDKSMSFAFVCGMVVWICTNGCISGDYQYKRVHRGRLEDDGSTTIEDIVENINGGFNVLQNSFESTRTQLNEMKHFEISPEDTYNIVGELYFKQEVLSSTQLSIVKKQLASSSNFRHLGDTNFTAYDLYNHITEALKESHPATYISDHVKTHNLFKKTFELA